MRQILLSFAIVAIILASCAPAANSLQEQGVRAEETQLPTVTENTDPAYAAEPTFTTQPAAPAIRATPDLSMLPIGDGLSSDSPRVGYLWNCAGPEGGGGPMTTGTWFDEANGVYNLLLRPSVDGAVSWTNQVTISVQGDTRVIEANGLPVHTTGTFPIASSDDAYQYDRNPHTIEAQTVRLELPASPQQTTPSCASGDVGITIQGVLIFNGFDALERDAIAHEIQDACFGHPQQNGVYHYHGYSPCLEDQNTTGASSLIGYALDGFGIFGPYDENGHLLTSADLDECHGRTSLIEWDGQMVEMYHYVATYDFPYTVGCFRGTPTHLGGQQGGETQQQNGPEAAGGPPPTPSNGGYPPLPPQP